MVVALAPLTSSDRHALTYGHPWLADTVVRLGAIVVPIPVYRWTPPADTTPMDQMIRATIGHDIDGITFTSAPAVASMLGRARDLGVLDEFLHALRTTSRLTPQLPTLVVAANGRLQRRTPTRWVGAVLRQAREIAADADVRKTVLERSGHFVMLDRPQRMADLILTLGSR